MALSGLTDTNLHSSAFGGKAEIGRSRWLFWSDVIDPKPMLPSAWGECGTNVEDAWPSVTLRSWLTRYLALHRGQSSMQRCYHLRALSDGCGDALD
jgi:hypothetical protein